MSIDHFFLPLVLKGFRAGWTRIFRVFSTCRKAKSLANCLHENKHLVVATLEIPRDAQRDILIKWNGSNPLLIAFGFLQRCAILQYHQQTDNKDEEASKAGSQILSACCNLVAHPVGDPFQKEQQ